MDFSQFQFAHFSWLWALVMIPLTWVLFFLYYRKTASQHKLETFIDKHLIPYLLLGTNKKKKKIWNQLFLWSVVWSCLVIALAGPRWDFREISTFTRDQSLAILLDLSESMNARDVSPSRLGRAKQRIEDLLDLSKGVKMGLIAFAADPHMIVPMTDDKDTIKHLLSSLDTDLVYVQGSKLSPALDMAATALENEPGNNKAIIIISDGGFEDSSAIYTAQKLSEKGILLYTMGVGSLEGAPLRDRQGAVTKKNGSPIVSKLEQEKFSEISKMGKGRYFDAGHSEQLSLIFEDLKKRGEIQEKISKTQRLWKEHFYLFLVPILPLFLWWYQRGYIIACVLFITATSFSNASLPSFFYNQDQQGEQAYKEEDYSVAASCFQDPYRRGVAYYRMGDYKSAEEMFRLSKRPEMACSAAYNLGNSLVQQNKLQQAIVAYEEVLEQWPDYTPAKENLELVKKMLEQQSSQEQENQESKGEKQDKEDTSKTEDNQESEKQDSQNNTSSQEKESKNEEIQKSEQEPPPSQIPYEETKSQDHETARTTTLSQEDLDADLWLNQIKNDPKPFLKNKFYLESKKNGTKEDINPW